MRLEVFHEDVCLNRGQGRTHCCSFHLLLPHHTLLAKQHLAPQLNQDRVMKNFSSSSLAPKELEALVLGLNFAVTPKQIPTFEIIAATEATASQLDSETAQ